MADDEQYSDEYQFADMDAVTPDSTEEGASTPNEGEAKPPASVWNNPDLKRKALIAGGVVIVLIVALKVVGIFSGGKKEAVQPKKTAPVVAQVTAKPTVITPIVPVVTPEASFSIKVNDKLALLDETQQTMRTDISAVNTQVGEVNQNLQTLLSKIADLNGVIQILSAKVDDQSHEIEQLTVRKKPVKKPSVRRARSMPTFHLQAVIPGRAWLIATNGATLTVREGSVIAGYGIVKLIDATDGRVTTSSGQVIRFAQNDS